MNFFATDENVPNFFTSSRVTGVLSQSDGLDEYYMEVFGSTVDAADTIVTNIVCLKGKYFVFTNT